MQIDTGEFRIPNNLALNQLNIDCAGNENDLRKLCESVRELDLADNKLICWTQVGTQTSLVACIAQS